MKEATVITRPQMFTLLPISFLKRYNSI